MLICYWRIYKILGDERMKKIKKVASLLIATAMVLTLAACGQSAAQSGESSNSAASTTAATSTDEKTKSTQGKTMRFAWWGGDSRHQATLAAIEKYHELNPGVKIEAEYQGYDGYYEKIVTMLSNGTAPDIFLFMRDWASEIQGENKYLADLNEVGVDLSGIEKSFLDANAAVNNQIVLFPATSGGEVLYFNTDFVKKHNIDISVQLTWDSLMEYGQKVNQANPDEYLMTADVDVLGKLVMCEYLSQLTGKPMLNDDYTLNVTQQQIQQAFELIVKLYETNTLEPFGESAVFVGQMDQNIKWVNGQIGMLLDVGGSAQKYESSTKAPVDCVAIPTMKDALCSGVNYSGNRGFALNAASPNLADAAKFLDWLENSEEAAILLKDCQGVPASPEAVEALEKNNLINKLLLKAQKIAQPNSYTKNAATGNAEVETLKKDAIQQVIYGEITPEQAAKGLVEDIQKLSSK